MSLLRRLVLSGAALSAVVACSGTSGSQGGQGAADKGSFAVQYCQLIAPCCGKANLRTDGVACQNLITGTSNPYDAAAGTACVQEMNAASQAATFCDDLGASAAPSCKRVFSTATGAVAPGGACGSDSDCAPSSAGNVRCRSTSNAKICQVLISGGKEGDSPCVGTVDGTTTSYTGSSQGTPPSTGYLCDKASGLRCDSTTSRCARLQDPGGPCTSSEACVATAYCDTAKQLCAARIAAGGACSTSSSCVPEADCNTTSHTCVARLPDGSACKSGSECGSRACVNGQCGKSPGGTALVLALYCGGK